MRNPELVNAITAAYDRWQVLLAGLDEESLTQRGVEGEWSVKDVIAHIAVSERWLLAQLDDDVDAPPPMPPHMNPLDLHARNNWYYQLHRERPLADVLHESDWIHRRLVERVAELDDAELERLYTFTEGGEVRPADSADEQQVTWPRWGQIADITYEHYPQHIEPLQQWLNGEPTG